MTETATRNAYPATMPLCNQEAHPLKQRPGVFAPGSASWSTRSMEDNAPDSKESTDKSWQSEERLRELYVAEGMTMEQVAEELGCSGVTVSKWLTRFGIKTRYQTSGNDCGWRDRQTLERLYFNEGLTTHEIAERLDCSQSVVVKWMRKHRIEARSTADYHEEQWRDEDLLEEMYVEKSMSLSEIADEFGCSRSLVGRYVRRHEIKRPETFTSFYTDASGYERVIGSLKDEYVLIHRLVAVAEYGFDAVKDRHIHHGGGPEGSTTPWDNRPENLEPLTPSEHARLHNPKRD